MHQPLPIHDRQSALAYLYAHINYEKTPPSAQASRRFKLDRMKELLDLLGSPHERLQIVHIAGTKGKGSTASTIAAMLQAAGYSTGLYTSPHLERLEERFCIDGQTCSAGELVDLTRRVQQAVGRLPASRRAKGSGVTYFELTTALALLHFAERQVDVAVVEVGLGGRLDSTNVCRPLVSVITSISFDHMRQLGHTLELIAAEKAGIIKSGVPVVTGVTQEQPLAVIRSVARQLDAPLMAMGREFGFVYRGMRAEDSSRGQRTQFDYWDRAGGQVRRKEQLQVGLLGRHQAANAAVALATLSTLTERGWRCSPASMRAGLRAVQCPARIEVLSQSPTVVLDTAHNAASVAALRAALAEAFCPRRSILVFATSADKDARQMLEHLTPAFQHLVFTRFQSNPRGTRPERLAEIARQSVRAAGLSGPAISVSEQPQDAWQLARSMAADDDLICITGSFFLAAEIRRHIPAGPV